mmetsp:Transcript_154135/g.494053  ORF Transcript_154135/g.494053 Transcript_154135/m.494053 type:complete len:241 (+) Transcript_154135:1389-2111(+)
MSVRHRAAELPDLLGVGFVLQRLLKPKRALLRLLQHLLQPLSLCGADLVLHGTANIRDLTLDCGDGTFKALCERSICLQGLLQGAQLSLYSSNNPPQALELVACHLLVGLLCLDHMLHLLHPVRVRLSGAAQVLHALGKHLQALVNSLGPAGRRLLGRGLRAEQVVGLRLHAPEVCALLGDVLLLLFKRSRTLLFQGCHFILQVLDCVGEATLQPAHLLLKRRPQHLFGALGAEPRQGTH